MHDFLEPLPYQRAVADALQAREPKLWAWFASAKAHADVADRVRLELLKTAYRLEREQHRDAYAHIEEAGARLGVDSPVTLYQSQQGGGLNAAMCWVPGEAHLVLTGPILTHLTADEARAVMAHELAHFLLWERFEHRYFVAAQVLGALARHPQAEPSHVRTAQRLALYAETYADRAALRATGDPLATVSSLVKLETGVAEVSAESYLRQADEILAREDAHAEGQTHPETFLRARAVRLWHEGGADAGAAVARMIEGPLRLDALDLPGQERVQAATRRLLRRMLSAPTLQSESLLAHARLYFDDFAPADPGDRDPGLAAELGFEDEGLRDYLCYVLLDFVAADPALEDAPLVAAFALAEPLGFAERLQAVAAKELKRKKKALEQARKEGAAVAREAQGGEGAA